MTYMCRVTPCSLRSCTLKLVAKMSLLNSSNIRTFQTSDPCGPSSTEVEGEVGRGNGPADALAVGGA